MVGRSSSAERVAASRFEIQKRGTETGIERNFDSAEPRIVWSGSMKMTALAPRRAALSQLELELNSTSTTEFATSRPLNSLRLPLAA